MSVQVLHGDMREVLPTLSGLDACVCDPPYHLTNNVGTRSPYPGQYTPIGRPEAPKGGFMGKQWDGGDIAMRPEAWRLVYDALKPGAHLLAFGGSRTWHRMAVAIEDAGFEIRDCLIWLYGTGFPKSLNAAQAIDATVLTGKSSYSAMADIEDSKGGGLGKTDDSFIAYGEEGSRQGKLRHGARREKSDVITPEAAQWVGWGTALKPAFEPIILARKPLDGTVAANVLKHGTGAINIDACRIGTETRTYKSSAMPGGNSQRLHGGDGRDADRAAAYGEQSRNREPTTVEGRWPANVLHDGSDEVEAAFAVFNAPGQQGRARTDGVAQGNNTFGALRHITTSPEPRGDTGTASRFFYSAKASRADRAGSKHPTVKPLALMRWLVRLVTPLNGTVLDCFAGSGTTGEAAMLEGFNAVLIEREDEYIADINRRIERATQERTTIITTAQLDMFA